MQIEELAAKLQVLGLSGKQARVLVAGMLLGPAPASRIAEQAGISRPSAYDILAELEGLGLAQRSNNEATALYVVADYAGLESWFGRQQVRLAERREQLRVLEAELTAVARTGTAEAPRVRFVQGLAGIEAIRDESFRKAKPGSILYSMTNHDETLKRYPDNLNVNSRRRLKKRLRSRQFYYDSQRATPSDPAILKETKRLSRPSKGDVVLYDDRAVLLSYEGDWSGVVIDSTAIVATLRQLFELAWENQKTVENS